MAFDQIGSKLKFNDNRVYEGIPEFILGENNFASSSALGIFGWYKRSVKPLIN